MNSDSESEAPNAAAVDNSRVEDLADAAVDVVQDGGRFVGMLDALHVPAHSDSESEALSPHAAAAGTARVADLSEVVSDLGGRRDRGIHKEVRLLEQQSMQHEVAMAVVRTAWASQMLHHGESLADGLDTGRSQSTRSDGRAWMFEGGMKLAFGGIGNTNPHHSRVLPNILDAMSGVSVS